MSDLQQLLGCSIDFSNNIGLIQVSMIPFVVGCHIHIDDVTILQRPLVGDAMAHDLHISNKSARIRVCIQQQIAPVAYISILSYAVLMLQSALMRCEVATV